MVKDRPYRMIISGGGTGGHIFPAVAIADKFREKHPDAMILFVGAKGKMEMARIPKAGYEIIGLWISGLQRKITLSNFLFPVKVLSSFLKAKSIINEYKPHVVVGTGGYASGPMMMAATKMGIPTLVQEQNSHAGLANKNVAKKANTICVAYEGMEKYFPKEKIVFTGNPVRMAMVENLPDRNSAVKYWNLNPDAPVILILGGSQGARTINDSVVESLAEWTNRGYQVIWQTGKIYIEEMKQKGADYINKGVVIIEFIDDMKAAYGAADVIVSRAGALSVSEQCLVKKPVIYIPSPNVAEDHQRKNAMALTRKNAALMIEDNDARAALAKKMIALIEDKDKQRELSLNIASLAKPDATDDIINEIEKLIN